MFNAREIATDLAENFLSGAADKVEVLFGEFQICCSSGSNFTRIFSRFSR